MNKLRFLSLVVALIAGVTTSNQAQNIDVDLSIEFAGIDCGQSEACYNFFVADAAANGEDLAGMAVRIVIDDAIFNITDPADVIISRVAPDYTLTNPTSPVSAPGSVAFGFDGNAYFWYADLDFAGTMGTEAEITSSGLEMFQLCFPINPAIDVTMTNVCSPIIWDADNSGDNQQSWIFGGEGAAVEIVGPTGAIEVASHFAWTPSGNFQEDGTPYGDAANIGSGQCIANCNLPVDLLAFDAEYTSSGDGLLTWKTASEEENSHFDIERSLDGFNFEKIGEVEGAGTTSIEQSYFYTDYGVESLSASDIYYRLKQVDFDGRYEYSEIEVINVDGSARLDVISVRFGGVYKLKESFGDGIHKVDVYAMNGQLISTNKYDHLDVVDLNTDGLAKGVYVLRINDKYTKRLVVVR